MWSLSSGSRVIPIGDRLRISFFVGDLTMAEGDKIAIGNMATVKGLVEGARLSPDGDTGVVTVQAVHTLFDVSMLVVKHVPMPTGENT
ncbi:TPA: hypothetical protein ACP7Q5_004898 [Escherichia coli]|jgi:hypothetical protein|uniref:hypothetical protein n=2 Tax=Bacteria TaxID=2 RepID=UPI0037048655